MYDEDLVSEESVLVQPEGIGQYHGDTGADSSLGALYCKEEITSMIQDNSPRIKLVTNSWTKSKAWNDFYCIEVDAKVVIHMLLNVCLLYICYLMCILS